MDLENIDDNISGIYRITCNKNAKNYIGVSKDIKKRWYQHVNMLKNKTHHSTKLQEDYNKYGEDVFEFRIIIKEDYGEAKRLEDKYIEKYQSDINGYNCQSKLSNYRDRDSMRCKQILEYIKDSYVPDGNVYCYNLFNMAKYLNITVTKLLKFIGINSEHKFNIYRYLDNKTMIGLNWSNENIFAEIFNVDLFNNDSNFKEVDIVVFS